MRRLSGDTARTFQLTDDELAAMKDRLPSRAFDELRRAGPKLGVTTLAFRKAAAAYAYERAALEEYAALVCEREHLTGLVQALGEIADLRKELRSTTKELERERDRPHVQVAQAAMAQSARGTTR